MKVLILAYDFPPFVSVGGLRPHSWLKYLPQHGIEPVVITRQWSNHYGDERDYVAPGVTDRVETEVAASGLVIRTPYRPNLSNRLLLSAGRQRYRWLRRIVTGWYEVAQYPLDVGPKVRLYEEARRYLSTNHVDAILATGDPFVLFRYAADLSREFGVPWVADYRDPWSQDRRRPRLLRTWEGSLERRLVASAALVTTAAEAFRPALARMHRREIAVVPNGFDPEAVAVAAGVEQDDAQLTIAFAGAVHAWFPLQSVFGVLQSFLRSAPGAPIAVRMIGVNDRERLAAMTRDDFPDLAPRVTFTGRLPNPVALQELAHANVLLMFNMYANPGTKVYDYMAVRRRILLCYSQEPEAEELKTRYYNLEPGADDHVLERLVEETRSGTVVRDATHLRRVLEELRDEFARYGKIACDPVGTERYSRAALAGRMAALLEGLPK